MRRRLLLLLLSIIAVVVVLGFVFAGSPTTLAKGVTIDGIDVGGMQAKAARLRLRATEIPVGYRRRRFGKSKISGTWQGSLAAGFRILVTVYRCWRHDAAA